MEHSVLDLEAHLLGCWKEGTWTIVTFATSPSSAFLSRSRSWPAGSRRLSCPLPLGVTLFTEGLRLLRGQHHFLWGSSAVRAAGRNHLRHRSPLP